MKRLLKEPLLHFLLIGTGLFLLFGWGSGSVAVPQGQAVASSPEIIVSAGEVRHLMETFEKTWQRAPTDADMQKLIDDYVRDEVYYREAQAAGLDRDDSVIRRRLRMKMEFLFEDIGAQVEPTDVELRAYLEKHSSEYRTESRIGFRQVFISADRRGAKAETDAREILNRLNSGAAPETFGDATLLELEVRLSPLGELRQQYGETFSNRLLELKPGRWEGPLRSGFGLHLVRIEQREEGSLPELSAVREKVKQGWLVARQQELKDAAYAKLKERYRVVVEKPAETSVAAAAGKRGVVN
jgi:hypothetical protein